jgi:hypothetical protein
MTYPESDDLPRHLMTYPETDDLISPSLTYRYHYGITFHDMP